MIGPRHRANESATAWSARWLRSRMTFLRRMALTRWRRATESVSARNRAPGDVEVGVDDHLARITAAGTLYLVIMKSFNMKDVDLKHTISRIGWKLERDEHGRLFHPGMRAMFDPLK